VIGCGQERASLERRLGFTRARPYQRRSGWLLAGWFVLQLLARGETAVQVWEQRCGGPGGGAEQPYAMAVDLSNNIIVTGRMTGNGTNYDYATLMYSSAGQPRWTNFYNGPTNSDDVAYSVAIDSSNAVIVTGYSITSASYQDYDYLTIKYSSAGLPLWTNRYNGNALDMARAVAADSSNNVIVTGYSYSGSAADYATIKYSGSGTPVWTNRYSRYNGHTKRHCFARALAIDGGNNIIVTGISAGSLGDEFATVKYSSTGIPLWTNLSNAAGVGSAGPLAMAVGSSNDVIVTGYLTASAGNQDYATIKYSSAGQPLWTNVYNGSANAYDCAAALATDRSNNIIVTGTSTTTGNLSGIVTIQYSSAGTPLWTNCYCGPSSSNSLACSIALDGGGNSLVTGSSSSAKGQTCYVTIKYSTTGTPLWTNCYHGPPGSTNVAAGVAVDHAGAVLVTGRSADLRGDYDYATIKYEFPLLIADFRFDGGTPGMLVDNLQTGAVTIEASADLADWVPVFTNTTPTNTLVYTDPDAGNAPTRFYRAVQTP
jgi:uncharacterized delta-60 repeat protein